MIGNTSVGADMRFIVHLQCLLYTMATTYRLVLFILYNKL